MTGKDRVELSTWFTPAEAREGALSARLVTEFLHVEKMSGKKEIKNNV